MAPPQRTIVRRDVRIPDELITKARQAVGDDAMPLPQLVRLGLARLAGVDVEPYTLRPGPRGPRRRKAPPSPTLPLAKEPIAS